MPTPRSATEFQSCPVCGDELERGYLLGKHNRIRWSRSPKGMTIFHGAPLIRLEQSFWRQWKWWSYAPSIAAVRCEKCRLVSFRYNNDIRENPKKEQLAAVIIGGCLAAAAIALVAFTSWLWRIQSNGPLVLTLLMGVMSLFLLLLGAIFLVHAIRSSH